jgi:hypothetical protein
MYCHQQWIGGEYKVHEQLTLKDMEVSDLEDPTGCSFFISHPTKSFVVIADSMDSKEEWLAAIQQTIQSCLKRHNEVNMRQRRMSFVHRIEAQQQTQLDAQERRSMLLNQAAAERALTRIPSDGLARETFGGDRTPIDLSFENSPVVNPIGSPSEFITHEQRQQQQRDAIAAFEVILEKLDDQKLENMFTEVSVESLL